MNCRGPHACAGFLVLGSVSADVSVSISSKGMAPQGPGSVRAHRAAQLGDLYSVSRKKLGMAGEIVGPVARESTPALCAQSLAQFRQEKASTFRSDVLYLARPDGNEPRKVFRAVVGRA